MSVHSNFIVKDSEGREYRIVQETAYHVDTPDRVILLLEQARQARTRFKFHYGDLKTGKAWGDVEVGTVGRSTGEIKIPLLIKSRRSMGGTGLLDNCIIKIEHANKKDGTAPLWDITGRGFKSND